MLLPLGLLSFGAIFCGVFFYSVFVGGSALEFFSEGIFVANSNHILHEYHYVPKWVKIMPFCAMVLGFLIALNFYIINSRLVGRLVAQHNGLYRFLLNKWYFDELFDILFVRTTLKLGEIFWKKGDILIIDGFINKIALGLLPQLNRIYSRIQSGFLFDYAFGMIAGVIFLITWVYLS